MHIEIISDDKDDIEFKIDNPTVAELMRVYLNEHGAKFAAWRREHPSKPVIMKIQASSVKKAVSDAAESVRKELAELESFAKK